MLIMSSVFCKCAKRCLLDNSFCRYIALLFFILLTSLVLFQVAFAAQITLVWDPNTDSSLAGYKIHFGTLSRNYFRTVDAGKVTTYTLTGLTQEQSYFIVVTAYNKSNKESSYSNEVMGVAKEPVQAHGDFSGDGKIDLLWRHKVTGENLLWFMNDAIYLDSGYFS